MTKKPFVIALAAVLAIAVPAFAQVKEPQLAWGDHVGPQPPSTPPRNIDWVEQAELAAAHAGWQRFTSENPGWIGLFDARNGQLEYAYGPGIQVLPAMPSQQQVATTALGLKERLLPHVGMDPADFELKSVMQAGRLWYVHLIQRVGVFRVWNARLTLRIDLTGKLVMWGGRFVDTNDVVSVPGISSKIGAGIAQAHLRDLGYVGPNTEVTATTVEPVVHVRDDRVGLLATATWLVKMIGSAPRADWVVFVDASSGAVVEYWNDLRECGCGDAHGHTHEDEAPTVGGGVAEGLAALSTLAMVSGFVKGDTHEGLLPHQAPATTNFPDIRVTIGGTNVVTDATGFYTFNGGGATVSVSCGLDGPWVNSSVSTGINASFSSSTGSGTFDLVFTNSNSTIGQRDMAFFANKTHATLKLRAPTQTLLDNPITANANLSSGSCNAFYSPQSHSINFYNQSGSCINTATSASVVAHEFGHGISTRIYSAAGASVPGHLGEGLSDCVGGAVEDTSIVGSGFTGPGSQVRNMNNGCQYPSSCGSTIHSRGLVIGGCYWHTRVQFANAFGQAGKDTMDEYLFQHLSAGAQDETIIVMEMLLLDDNDGNLTNGTPNVEKFFQGFSTQHGVPFPLQLVSVAHVEPGDSHDQLQPYQIFMDAVSITGSSVASATLFWRAAGSSNFTLLSMTNVGGDTWMGSIPNQAASGATVEYYISAQAGSTSGTSPAGAPGATHRFRTAPSQAFFADGFETPSGWTHVQVAQQDDWHNNVHGNSSHPYDPATAFEGVLTWGNDLVPAPNWNGDYAANVNNHLTSPPIDCSGRTGTTLVYRRWLTVEDAFYDQARILVSNNGSFYQQMWQNPVGSGTQHLLDSQWVEHIVDISAIADGQSNVRIRFQLITDGGLQFGGWNIDDLRLEASNVNTGDILTTSGSTSVGNLWSLHMNGAPGDVAVLVLSLSTPGVYYPGLGTASVDVTQPDSLVLIPFAQIPASGQITISAFAPNLVGTTFHAQGILFAGGSVNASVISNVISETVTP